MSFLTNAAFFARDKRDYPFLQTYDEFAPTPFQEPSGLCYDDSCYQQEVIETTLAEAAHKIKGRPLRLLGVTAKSLLAKRHNFSGSGEATEMGPWWYCGCQDENERSDRIKKSGLLTIGTENDGQIKIVLDPELTGTGGAIVCLPMISEKDTQTVDRSLMHYRVVGVNAQNILWRTHWKKGHDLSDYVQQIRRLRIKWQRNFLTEKGAMSFLDCGRRGLHYGGNDGSGFFYGRQMWHRFVRLMNSADGRTFWTHDKMLEPD